MHDSCDRAGKPSLVPAIPRERGEKPGSTGKEPGADPAEPGATQKESRVEEKEPSVALSSAAFRWKRAALR